LHFLKILQYEKVISFDLYGEPLCVGL